MKKQLLYLLLFSLTLPLQIAAQCHNLTLPYGQVSVDINRGYKIASTQDGNFVIAGEWNSEAYLMKVDPEGNTLNIKKFGALIGGQSQFNDLVVAPDGGFVAVGHCDNCTVPNDSLRKVVVVKTDANLNIDASIGVKKFGSTTQGTFTTLNERFQPCIVRTGNEYTLAAGVNVGASINPQNTVVTRLTSSLETVWEKWYNVGYFEAPYDIVATNDGFIMPVNRAFLPTAALLKIDMNGNQQWIKPFTIDPARNMVYLPDFNQVVVTGDRILSSENRDIFLMRFDAATGAPLDSLLWGEALWDEGRDVQLLENGDLLVGARITLPNIFGTYGASRVYRVQTNPLQVLCYEKIPNPNTITTMSLTSVVPLSAQGNDYAVAGIRGLDNRTFFHIREDCEVNYQNAVICPGSNYTLPDGQTVSAAGVYENTLTAASGCDSVIQTTVGLYPQIPTTTVEVVICPGESYVLPNGQVISSSGTYSVNIPSVHGCDSLVQTTVSQYPQIPTTTVGVTICPGELYVLPNGQVVSSSGTYSVNIPSIHGCDSLIQTVITVPNPITVESVDIQHDTNNGNGAVSLQAISGGTAPYTFYWSNNASGSTISALVHGTYTVTITDAAGCTAVAAFVVEMAVATSELSDGVTFSMFPNPFSEHLDVLFETTDDANTPFELRLTDSQGKLCRNYHLQTGQAELLDVAELPSGVYWAQLMENGKPVRHMRVVKMR
ncbi:MAG: T9SS type A sorting domain-containing protein [Bacteroidetes bacterium]|nr:T9SS type A sorting domain-containing protein [Bacteroidota bacterium]